MITREQALTLDTFHTPAISMRHCYVWRRNGQTQTWKTRPNDYRVPVKFGLYSYDQITQKQAHAYYAPTDCPACHGAKS